MTACLPVVVVVSSIDNRALRESHTSCEPLVIPAVMRIHSNYNPDVLNLLDPSLLPLTSRLVCALLHVRCNQRYSVCITRFFLELVP